MLYLIGGAPRLGKSIVAKKLANENRTSWLSTDALCAMLPNAAGMLFADEVDRPAADIVQKLWNEAESMGHPLRLFIEHIAPSQDELILEGVHLLPSLVRHIRDAHPAGVRSVFVLSSKRDVVLSSLRADTRANNWLRDASDGAREKMADFIVGYSDEVRKRIQPEEHASVFERTGDFQNDLDVLMRLFRC
jgi:2-phosphoglycerate kinase